MFQEETIFQKNFFFQSKNSFSHRFSKRNNFCEKPILKQILFHKNISKRKNVLKKNNFVFTSSYVQKRFSNHIVESDEFHNSKCVCYFWNKSGHLSFECPIKKSAHFGMKFVWVSKTNPQGPKIKRIPNVT